MSKNEINPMLQNYFNNYAEEDLKRIPLKRVEAIGYLKSIMHTNTHLSLQCIVLIEAHLEVITILLERGEI